MWLKVKKFNVNYIYEMIISIDFTNLVYHLYQYVAGNETHIFVKNNKRVEVHIITNV